MQQTIRVLRITLPIVFIAFIGVIALSWNRPKRIRDKAINTPPVVTRTGDAAKAESQGFEDTQTIAGRVSMHIRAKRVVGYNSGWNTLEDVALTIFRPTGLTYEITCPTAQFNSTTKEADAKGGVKLTSSDGVEVNTAEIHFDGRNVTNHIPVQFKVDRWTGRGGALDMDVPGETVRLYDKLDATMHPEYPGEAPMQLHSNEGIFRRKENFVDFQRDVVLIRQADRVTGDHIVGRFTADRKSLSGLEGQGHIVMNLAAESAVGGSSEELGGRKELTCDRFFSEVGADGTINALNAVMDAPEALAHALVEGPPRRDIVAKTFRVALQGKAVNEMKADNNVVLKELGETDRTVTGDHVTVYFDPTTHRSTNALIDGNFHYKDPKNEARAIKANYDVTRDLVILTAEPGFDPTVTSDGNTLKAKLIEFSPNAGTAKATGEVIAQLMTKQNGGASADSTNIFPAGKPVFVNSDLVTMRQETKIALFSGNVRAWQDTNTLFSQELQVQGAGDQITARGNVRTILYNTSSNEVRKTPMLSRSDQLVAHKLERRIDLVGNVKIDDETRHMTSEKAEFFFDNTHHLEHIEAENKLVLVDQATGRKGTGDKAIYQVAKKMVFLSGSPAIVTAPNGNVQGEKVALDLERNKVEILSPTRPTQGTYKQ